MFIVSWLDEKPMFWRDNNNGMRIEHCIKMETLLVTTKIRLNTKFLELIKVLNNLDK